MDILYITRKYPPAVGGAEKLNYEVVQALRKRCQVDLIAWGGKQRWLPFFAAYALISGWWRSVQRPPDVIFGGDAIMGALAGQLGRVRRTPCGALLAGLDITYPPKWYQRTVVPALGACRLLVCISHSTAAEAAKRGLGDKTVVIPPGIDAEALPKASPEARDEVKRVLAEYGPDRRTIITVGRLVRRKGVARFIATVLPRIVAREKDLLYLVVGDGPDAPAVRQAVEQAGMRRHVHMFGRVPPDVLAAAYEAAEVFVMPNQPVPGDMEGFGLVVLEANLFGLPVVAARLEGICDAVAHGSNGFLLDWDDAEGFARVIVELLHDPQGRQEMGAQAREYVLKNFGWDEIADRYTEALEAVVS